MQDLEKARRNLDILIENFNETIKLDGYETPHFNCKAWFPDEDKTIAEKIEEKENQINDEAFDRILSELYDGICEDLESPECDTLNYLLFDSMVYIFNRWE